MNLSLLFKALTAESKLKLLEAIRLRNGNLVELNPTLTVAVSSNTACYLLGSSEQATLSIGYVLSYLCKDGCVLCKSISLLREAKLHIDAYKSRADDAGTRERTATFFVQRLLNNITAFREVPDTFASIALLGFPSLLLSEKMTFVQVWGAVRYVLSKAQYLPPIMEEEDSETGEDDEEEDDGPLAAWKQHFDLNRVASTSNTAAATTAAATADADKPKGAARLYKVDGHTIPKTLHDNYANRGARLRRLTLLEYAAFVVAVPKKRKGRKGEVMRLMKMEIKTVPLLMMMQMALWKITMKKRKQTMIFNFPQSAGSPI